MSDEEWNWCLDFIVRGGESLESYDDFQGRCRGRVQSYFAEVSMRHKFNIGTIVSSTMVGEARRQILGQVEEYFISKLIPGDAFWFLEYGARSVQRGRPLLGSRSRRKDKSFVHGRTHATQCGAGPFWREKLEESATRDSRRSRLPLQPIISYKNSVLPFTRDQFLINTSSTRGPPPVYIL